MSLVLVGCAYEATTSRRSPIGSGGTAGAAGLGGSVGGEVSASGGSMNSAVGGAQSLEGGAQSVGGLAGSAGVAGSAGSGGEGGSISGSAGTSGNEPAAGSGGAPTPELLSVGKSAQTDSEETWQNNTVEKGNDGLEQTRWCAADGAAGHYWRVDLERSYTITSIEILWEQAAAYQYLIELSDDAVVWSPLIDETMRTDSTQRQVLPISGAADGRHVRITVTALPQAVWASFFEFSVYGF